MSSLMSPFQPCCVVGVATLKRGREVKGVSPGGSRDRTPGRSDPTPGHRQPHCPLALAACAFHRGLFTRVLSLKLHTPPALGGGDCQSIEMTWPAQSGL